MLEDSVKILREKKSVKPPKSSELSGLIPAMQMKHTSFCLSSGIAITEPIPTARTAAQMC